MDLKTKRIFDSEHNFVPETEKSTVYSIYDLRTENRRVRSCRANQAAEAWRVSCRSCLGSDSMRTCDKYETQLAIRKIRRLQMYTERTKNRFEHNPCPSCWSSMNLRKNLLFALFAAVYAVKTYVFDAINAKKELNKVRIPELHQHRHEKQFTNTNQQLNLA